MYRIYRRGIVRTQLIKSFSFYSDAKKYLRKIKREWPFAKFFLTTKKLKG